MTGSSTDYYLLLLFCSNPPLLDLLISDDSGRSMTTFKTNNGKDGFHARASVDDGTPNPRSVKKRTVDRASWTAPKDVHLTQLMITEARRGRQAENGFKKEAWANATSSFNKHFNVVYIVSQLKSRYAQASDIPSAYYELLK